jgi:hypothetical protein
VINWSCATSIARSLAAVGISLLLGASSAEAQRVPSDVTFSLNRSWLDDLLHSGPGGVTVGARWTDTFIMGEHSGVHALGADCELHAAAELRNNVVIADPAGIVAEPPNVCKMRVKQIGKGALGQAWIDYFDSHVTGQSCRLTGYPRIYSEHAAGGEAGSSNPDHVVELHPLLALDCGASPIAFDGLMRAYPKMKRITDASTIACLDSRKLYVRQRGTGNNVVYEFLEEGAKGSGGRCGNFAVVDAHITKQYIRGLENGSTATDSDHVALAQAWVGESGPFPLKLYTYRGTPENDAIVVLAKKAKKSASLDLPLHGLFTYDYFTIVQALQVQKPDGTYDWAPASSLTEYKEVSHPLSLVVFGRAGPE